MNRPEEILDQDSTVVVEMSKQGFFTVDDKPDRTNETVRKISNAVLKGTFHLQQLV
ncbi:MAG TPA: hypothetical protein VE621_19170 [Bryobacteraceae bacterium]|nr:hypothetical protein [Bryobacteraceae bacterium]